MSVSATVRAATKRNFAAHCRKVSTFWRPIVAPPICEWVENTLRFGPGSGGVQLESRQGPLTLADRPWWRFPLECFASDDCQSIAMPAATQIGKTVNLIMATMLYAAEFRPAPGMIILPDELEAKKFRDRLYALAQESARFKPFDRIRIPPLHKWNMQEIHLGSMLVHLAWAGSKQRTRGKPCWYVWMTEIDVYRDADDKAGDPVEAGKQRTKDVFRYKHVFESSPRESPSTIHEEEQAADSRWRWFIPCPHCGLKQEARFFTYRTGPNAGRGGIELTVRAMGRDGADLMTSREAREHAYYVCLNGCKIANKQALIESGEWLPPGYDFRAQSPPVIDRTPARSMGFHLWAIHSPNETFGSIAGDYLEHLTKGKKVDFFGNRLAIAYESETKIPKWAELGRRMAWTHARRTVPDECWFLTAGIDKQGENNGTRYVIRGWSPGRTSWLIDWGWVDRTPGDETELILSDLIEMERRVFVSDFAVVNRDNEPSTNPLGKQRLRVRLGNIDTKHLPQQIHRWMRQLPDDWVDRLNGDEVVPGRVRNIHGDTRVRADVRYKHGLVESNSRTGEKYEGGLHLWGVNVYPFYSDLTDLISGEPGHVGSWYVTADVLSQGRDYLEQVTNFQYAIRHDPKKGKKGEWGPRSLKIPNDFWDCEVYAMAAAEMVVGSLGWDASAWQGWKNQQNRKYEASRSERPRTKERRRRSASIGDR